MNTTRNGGPDSTKPAALSPDEVRAIVAARWPDLMQSPLAVAFRELTAADESDRAIDFARLQAVDSNAADREMRREAAAHAAACIETCEAQGIDFDEETLSANVESNFPDLDADACDEIAAAAIARRSA